MSSTVVCTVVNIAIKVSALLQQQLKSLQNSFILCGYSNSVCWALALEVVVK